MMRKLVLCAVIALAPGLAFAAAGDVKTDATVKTDTAKSGAVVKPDAAKTDATVKTDAAAKPDATKTDTSKTGKSEKSSEVSKPAASASTHAAVVHKTVHKPAVTKAKAKAAVPAETKPADSKS